MIIFDFDRVEKTVEKGEIACPSFQKASFPDPSIGVVWEWATEIGHF